MKKILLSLMIALGASSGVQAQLADGAIAPNFTLTDLDGNSHELYSYLNEGKAVFIKFFACHCPACWSYHQTGKLDDLYEQYGPEGTDQVMVLMLEYDPGNGYNEFHGITQGWPTQGDWVTGNSVPIINVEGEDRSLFTDYNLNYYPMIMKVCPDKTVEEMATAFSVEQLFQKANDCPGTLSIENLKDEGKVYFNHSQSEIILDGFSDVKDVRVLSSAGQELLHIGSVENNAISIDQLNKGIYFVQVSTSVGTIVKTLYI